MYVPFGPGTGAAQAGVVGKQPMEALGPNANEAALASFDLWEDTP